MHQGYNRRTATKVKRGRVQRKNNHVPTGALGYVLDRQSPGRGFRHVVTKRDLQTFVDLIPDWEKLSARLERIILVGHNEEFDGEHTFYHREKTGSIALCPWPEDLWREVQITYFDRYDIFTRIGVSHDRLKDCVVCRFTEAQARAYVLLHVFLHELGHHYDKINQKHRDSSRGEEYADRFAATRSRELYADYIRTFGDPVKCSA
jgi:hypothetical protein